MILAGDFNIVRGFGDADGKDAKRFWAARYETVFSRMTALCFRFMGPQAPHGRQADPRPEELPRESKNVPTYHSSRQSPATATRQLDFVFASDTIADRVQVRALNGVDESGPRDHCRVTIEIGDTA